MLNLVAFSKSGISVFRQYEEVNNELIDNVVDLSSDRGFSCSKVLVIDGNDVVFDFVRGQSEKISRRNQVELKKVLRKINKNDYNLLRKAYAKALVNLDCANFLM